MYKGKKKCISIYTPTCTFMCDIFIFFFFQAICVGPESLQVMYPAIFEQLLQFVEFSCKPPQFGKMETKHVANAKYNQVRVLAPHYITHYFFFFFLHKRITFMFNGLIDGFINQGFYKAALTEPKNVLYKFGFN